MKLIPYLLFLIPVLLFSQSEPEKIVEGRVQNENNPLEDVVVTNSTTGEFSTTDLEGKFRLRVKLGDTLSFTHLSFETFSETMTSQILNRKLVNIQVSDKVNRLDEVEVNAFPNINAVSLGILDHQPEQLTTNERRLKTAGDFKPIHLLSLLGGVLPLDPIINKISGKTDRIKKLIEMDTEEDYFDFIIEHHRDFIATELEFSEEELNRFVYFLIDNEQIQASIQDKDHSQLQFFIQDLAFLYREEQESETFNKN